MTCKLSLTTIDSRAKIGVFSAQQSISTSMALRFGAESFNYFGVSVNSLPSCAGNVIPE
jgi:hypothetical protein